MSPYQAMQASWNSLIITFDELVKSRKIPFFVIPAKAVIQLFQLVTEFLGSGFHRSDDFLRNHQCYFDALAFAIISLAHALASSKSDSLG
jgi:hypothetical protein